jgi:serine/threonine-protein kinase RsbW
MDLAGSVARLMGFPEERVEDIRTAVLEATLNAIEHGNQFDPAKQVCIMLTPSAERLEITVRDRARRRLVLPSAAPSLEAQLAGRAPRRGWGTFLIRSLVDEVDVSSTGAGNRLRMVVHLGTGPDPDGLTQPG